MNFGELLWWYLGNARDYAAQMLPCMCAGMAVYALALPVRRRRLDRLGLVSPRRRELALLLWEAAGTPAPAALLPADAAPVQQALAWAIENQLLAPDASAEDSVSRWEVIRSWNQMKG